MIIEKYKKEDKKGMKTWVICDSSIYSQQERAKEILFNKVSAKAFVPAFVFEGTQYYKRIK